MASLLYDYVVPQGVIVPDTSTIQIDVTNEYTSVFGDDLITTPNSPAGLLITAEVMARTAVVNNNAALANEINPNIAGGVYLDALMALTGVERVAKAFTQVSVVISGTPGTFIAAGALASETVNNALFELQASVTIPFSGTVAGLFAAVVAGAVPCEANTLTVIVSNVLGWLTVNNPTAAIPGAQAESDEQARAFRQQTLFAQGASMAGAIMANVMLVQGVQSLTFRENEKSTTQTVDGVSMVAHSMYACVSGGTDLAVATAIAQKKDGGCSYNNGASSHPVTQPVTQPQSGQVTNVLFDRPDVINVIARATVSQGTSAIPNLVLAVQSACYNYAQGLPSPPGIPPALTVGADLSAFELAGAITAAIPGVYVSNVQVSLATPVSWVNVITSEIWEQLFFTSYADIAVTVV